MSIWPFNKKSWPNFTLEDIRKRARILVVDDMEFVYLKLFQKDGYTVDKWDDIDDLQKLESGYFDVILLDIQGIGKAQSQEQGFGILKHLRNACPAQIIVAYSSADFSLKYQEFFKMADATLAKSDDYVQFKRTIDNLLAQRFSIGFYLDRIAKMASPYLTDTNKLRELSSAAILDKDKKGKLISYLQENLDNKEVLSMIIKVVEIAIGIAAL